MSSPQCCGNLKGRLVHERGNLARLARIASIRKGKGLIVTQEALDDIAKAKVAIENVKQTIIDHEADHAGQPEVA